MESCWTTIAEGEIPSNDSLSHIPVGPAGERPTNSQVGGEIDWKYSLKIELFFFFLLCDDALRKYGLEYD